MHYVLWLLHFLNIYFIPLVNHSPSTLQERRIIDSLYMTFGPRWSFIASHLQRRTPLAVRNYWYNRRRLEQQSYARIRLLMSIDRLI